jgi:hypothetical protein
MHMHMRAACMVDEGSQRLSSPVFESSVPPIHFALGCAMYRYARRCPLDALCRAHLLLRNICSLMKHIRLPVISLRGGSSPPQPSDRS